LWAITKLSSLWQRCLRRLQPSDCRLLSVMFREELHFLYEQNFADTLAAYTELVVQRIIIPSLTMSFISEQNIGDANRHVFLEILAKKLLKSNGDGRHLNSIRPFFRSAGPSSLCFAALAQDPFLISDAVPSRSLLSLLENKLELLIPKKYLLDELPLVLYYLLMSPATFAKSYQDICQGELARQLESLTNLLEISLSLGEEDEEMNTDQCLMRIGTFHQVLLPLIWSLGSEFDHTSQRSLKATLILCYHYKMKSWVPEKRRLKEKVLIQAAQALVPDHFLYIMSNLLQQEWNQQSNSQQRQCLRALHQLILLLSPHDVAKFLPKVFKRVLYYF
jgi:hypothetical protein